MSGIGFAGLVAVGVALAVGPHLLALRRGSERNLTVWILSMIGVGIIVGALFRQWSPETFDPLRPEFRGEAQATFDLSSERSFRVHVDGEDVGLLAFGGPGNRATASPAETAVLINAASLALGRATERVAPIRAHHDGDRIVIRGISKGDGSELRLEEAAGGLVALGLSPGTARGEGPATSLIRDLHNFLKDIFLNALMMMIVPVIFTSIIAGMLSLGTQGIGRIGMKTLAYYMTTSLLAILVGLFLVNIIAPGEDAVLTLEDKPSGFEETANQSASEFLFAFFRNLIPTNPIRAMAEGNILQIIVFALLIGFFTNRLPTRYRESLTTTFEGLFDVMLLIVRALLWLAPLGVYAIFVKVIAETGPEAFIDLGWYALAVLLGLFIHAGVTLPLMVRVFGRVSPWRHFKAMSPALLTAFSTSSSSATLPMTMRCVKERVGVSDRTSSFVLPLGATVNMDGTALYECVAAVFIAQIYVSQGVIPELTFGQQFLVVFTALAASIGAAGVPMAGMVMLGIILKALNLPLEGVGYVLAVDRILDMCRTTVNVWSDCCGCVVIAKSEGEEGILEHWPPPELT
jgi:Na+/H+-dicarboxylate symporter